MTPQELLARIEALEQKLKLLDSSNTIPRNVETAFSERLALGTSITVTGTGSATAATVYNAFPVTAPAQPSGTLIVVVGGVTYNLLYK